MPQPPVKTEYEQRLIALEQCLKDLQKQVTLEGIGKIAQNFLSDQFQFELVWIASYQPQARTLEGITGYLPDPNKDQGVVRGKQLILPGDFFDQVLLTGCIQEIPSLKQEQRAGNWQTVAQRHKIQGTVILPIRYRHQSLGILLVGTTLWGGNPRSAEMNELKMFTGILGAVLSALGHYDSLQPTEPPTQQFTQIISRILATRTFADRLKLVLDYTHTLLQPSRTCLYWFNAQAQSCRLQEVYTGSVSSKLTPKPQAAVEIELHSIAPFYQTTLQNQVVAIADIQGVTHNHHAPTRLMNLTKSRSWLSAPILDRHKLVGVLAIEGNEPRLWSDTDKQNIQLMAQLMSQDLRISDTSLSFGTGGHNLLTEMLAALKETERDPEQWDTNLKYCLEQVGLQFSARWVGIIRHNPELKTFECKAQFHQKKKTPLSEQLSILSDVDSKLLTRMSAPITVQSVEEDLKLLAWRKPFLDCGLKSYLLVKLSRLSGIGEFLILGSDLTRTWTEAESETALSMSQKLGQALSRQIQWQQTTLQQQLNGVLNEGIRVIQASRQVEQLFSVSTQTIDQLLGVDCLVILRWAPNQQDAKVAGLVNRSKFQVDPSIPIPWQTDELIQSILKQSQAETALPPILPPTLPQVVTLRGTAPGLISDNSGWIYGPNCAALLAVPLQIHPEDPALGIVLALESHQRHWSKSELEGVQLLVRELTVHYRSHYLIQHLSHRQKTLESLNWYKQRSLESLCRAWTEQAATAQSVLMSPVPDDAVGSIDSKSLQSISQLHQSFTDLEEVLKTEVWNLNLEPENISVATLMRRSLAKIEEVVQTRKLWTQVHNLTPNVLLYVPSQKLELMLVELLLAACYRTKTGDHIDIWCRALQENWVEISITDTGRLNPRLVSAIQNNGDQSSLDTTLESMPGLHFKICQSLVERMGGQLELAQLEDGRALSRLILPVA
jgi:GAF domain-containing protein